MKLLRRFKFTAGLVPPSFFGDCEQLRDKTLTLSCLFYLKYLCDCLFFAIASELLETGLLSPLWEKTILWVRGIESEWKSTLSHNRSHKTEPTGLTLLHANFLESVSLSLKDRDKTLLDPGTCLPHPASANIATRFVGFEILFLFPTLHDSKAYSAVPV